MAINRRQLLGAILASAALRDEALADSARTFVSCRLDAAGSASVAVFDLAGKELFATAIPSRGHDITLRPGARHLVVFARRPGNWFAAIDAASGAVLSTTLAASKRRFYGHGVFSSDGQLLYATEDDTESGQGLIGVYDATAGYRRVGEFPSGGIGPHDIALAPDGATLLVANGGLRTNPQTGREMSGSPEMKPNLAFADPHGGSIRAAVVLDASLNQLSIRHLAMARDGSAVFGCQYAGSGDDAPPLVGTISADGAVSFYGAPEDALARMNNYVGSVSLDASEEVIAATSPRGGQAMLWSRRSGKLMRAVALSDVCGIAAAGSGEFAASSGNAGVRAIAAAAPDSGGPVLLNWVWDNHITGL